MKLRELRIIHAAMLGGTVLYTLLAAFLVFTGVISVGTGGLPIPMQYAGAAILLLMFAGVFLRRHLVGQISLDDPPEVRAPAYANAVIIGAALPEGGGPLLITLGIITSSATWILAGGLSAAFLMWQGRPTPEEAGLEP